MIFDLNFKNFKIEHLTLSPPTGCESARILARALGSTFKLQSQNRRRKILFVEHFSCIFNKVPFIPILPSRRHIRDILYSKKF